MTDLINNNNYNKCHLIYESLNFILNLLIYKTLNLIMLQVEVFKQILWVVVE